MPPWRTTVETFEGSSPLSFEIVASASSAEPRCCTSKSGGTYSASITGVIGMTLISRTAPPEARASSTAVSSAGLTKSGSARSTGTRIFWNMAGLLPKARTAKSGSLAVRKRLVAAHVFAPAAQQVAGDIGERRPRQGREGEGPRHLD